MAFIVSLPMPPRNTILLNGAAKTANQEIGVSGSQCGRSGPGHIPNQNGC
jgi:hypothetical protein